ncbi:MAG: helix-turn-helix domain-containing protein [Salinibacter sp.]
MEDYLIGVGKHIRQLREERGLYGKELAQRADVSSGLISRIENGRTVPSLPVLLSIIQALNANPAEFFQGIADEQEEPYIVVSPDQHEPLEKEDARGFDYQQLFSKRLDLIGFEAMILTLQPGSEREKLTTDAFEFKYFLEGTCRFVIGDETVILEEGDLLFFDGRIPHVPKNRTDDLVRILVLYMYDTIPRQDGIKENT